MEYVYHGSKVHDLKELTPHQSTHGNYIYATPNKSIAIVMSKCCGNDITYTFGRNDQSKPYDLVERVVDAFDKMYSNDFSLYTLEANGFKDIHTGFNEVVSEHLVKVLKEEKYDNVFDAVKKLEEEGKIIIYRYPNRPYYIPSDDSDLLEKAKKQFLNEDEYDEKIRKITKWIFSHPNLEDKIKEFAYGLGYELPEYDEIVDFYTKLQKENPNKEFFVDESLKMKELFKGKTR